MNIRFASVLLGVFACGAVAAAQPEIQVRFTDSATGYGLSGDKVTIQPLAAEDGKLQIPRAKARRTGRSTFLLSTGRYSISANVSGYQPVATVVDTTTLAGFNLEFKLDPLKQPKELQPERVQALQREGFTLLQGFLVDDVFGTPLAAVSVSSLPSGAKTWTDARGFFRFYVPVPDEDIAGEAASLVFRKVGYRVEERQNLELWSGGDWTYCLRLKRGAGKSVLDENTERRRAPKPAVPEKEAPEVKLTPEQWQALFPKEGPHPMATAGSNATVRVPRNIRVLNQSSVIEYVSMDYYVKHSLPAEWISGWASYTGGSNSMNAGAVAVRCYAIAKLNAVTTSSTYDICATTSCQVYGTTTTTAANTAADHTANYVVVNGSGVIPSTEYSSENNQIGMACGDGYTAPTGGCLYDPVCTGEPEFGHGRGMCQWGTAKWATGRKFTGNSTGNATLNGFPRQDWKWIVNHYYPGNTLVKGAPLVIGDDVRVIGTSQTVRMCGDGTISSGTGCPSVTTKAVGSIGVIIDGPVQVTADGNGFTWYKIQWSDSTIGWTPENWLERSLPTPLAPTVLTATALATNQINLGWTDNATNEFGFKIERALTAGGPWTQIDTCMANTNLYSDTNGLSSGTTYYYRVRAFNFANSAYGNTANATTLSPSFPVITLQPWSQVKGLGQTVSFLTAAVGNNPLSYRWRKNGTNLNNGGAISGVTTTNLTLTGLQAADAGNYSVVVTNTSGAATSSVAALVVSGVITFQDDFDANTAANWVTNKSSTDTRVTFNYDYAADGIAAAPHAVNGTTRAVKMEANMNLGVVAAINISPVAQSFTGDYKLRFDMWLNANGPFPAGGTGSSQFITAGVGTTGTKVQTNGAASTADGVWFSVDGEGQAGDTSATSDFNAFAGNTLQAVGTGVYAAGTASNARGNLNPYYATEFPGGQTAPPLQQANYVQQSGALEAGTVGFVWRNVLINKSGNVIEWFIDDFKIAAITNAPLAGNNIFVGYWDPFTSLSDNDALSFGLVDNVRVEVPAVAANITVGPQPRTNAVGTSASFNVTATGFPAPNYQWRFNGANLGGATTSSYTVNPVTTNDAGGYSVVVSNVAGSVTSSVAQLTVLVPPTITTPPADQYIAAGATANFSVTATGSAPLSYQWRLSGTNLSGATLSSYSKANAQSADAGSYTAVVTNSAGAVTSAPALLVVNNPPQLPAIANRIIHAGVALTFTNLATDPDAGNVLSYTLDAGAPAAANVGATSGVFAWQTTDADTGTTNLTLRVTDNGVPPLNDAEAFTVTVLPRPSVQSAEISGGSFVLTWSAIPGAKYRVQFKQNLTDTNWTDLLPDVTAAGATASKSDLLDSTQKFYRVWVVSP